MIRRIWRPSKNGAALLNYSLKFCNASAVPAPRPAGLDAAVSGHAVGHHHHGVVRALDCGYYILTLRRPSPELFEEIPWSAEYTLSVSLAAAERAGRKMHMLERKLRDIDTAEDFRQWMANGNT